MLLRAFLLSFFIPFSVGAITIDDLNSGQFVQALPGGTSSITGPTSEAIGGFRTLFAEAGPGPSQIKRIMVDVDEGFLSHSQDAGITGKSLITWDGDVLNSLNPNGLSGIDLTQDAATAFVLEIVSFDFAGALPINVTVTVYDSSDPTGTRFSRGEVKLESQINSTTKIEIPFSKFTAHGSGGVADLKNVGAIQLQIDGTSQDVDLYISWFGTNGQCRRLPDANKRVIDECQVCGGDNSTCADCLGVPNGPAEFDICGICAGDGTSCLDCAGEPYGSATRDICGACNGAGDSCLGCVEQEQSSKLVALDGYAKQQEAVIKIVMRDLGRADRRPATAKFIKRTLAKAHQLQLRNWTLSWTFPRVAKICTNTQVCSQVSNSSISSEYQKHAEELRQIGLDGVRRLALRKGRLGDSERKRVQKIENLFSRAMKLLDQMPKAQFSCPTGKAIEG